MENIYHIRLLLLRLGMTPILNPISMFHDADWIKIPMVFFFFPETKGLELEDVDHLFSRGGITGGVWASRGYPVLPGHHRTLNTGGNEKPMIETAHIEV